MCISVLERQTTSFEEIALEKVYLNKTKQKKSCKKTCCCFSCFWKELQFSQLHDLWEAIPSRWYDLIFGSKAIPICTLEIVPTLALQLWSFVEFYLLSEPHPSYQVLPLCYCYILSLKMLRQSQHFSNERDLTGDLPPLPFFHPFEYLYVYM